MSSKNIKRAAIISLITGVVWIGWLLAAPSVKKRFLDAASERVEGRFLSTRARRSTTRTT